MKRIPIILVFLCYSVAARCDPENTCANDCASKGDKSYWCEVRCLQGDNALSAQPQSGTEISPEKGNAVSSTPSVPGTADLDRPGFYAYLDYRVVSYSNAPDYLTDGFLLGGGYQFNRHLGVEAGISIIKDATSGTCYNFFATCPSDSLSASSYQISLVGTLPLDKQNEYAIFAKLGWAHTSLSYLYAYTPCSIFGCGATVTGSGSSSKTNPMFGIGWEQSTPPLKFRVQYEYLGTSQMVVTFSDKSSKTYNIGMDVFSVGIVVSF